MKDRAVPIVAFILLVIWVGVAAAQTPIVITPTDSLAFDYFDADFLDGAVLRFEAQYDTGSWVVVDQATAFTDAQTQPGATSYRAVPPFTGGNHAVTYRACNAYGCSGGSGPIPFGYGTGPAGVPSNVRKVLR